jgi:hypothetical protein
VFRNVGYWTPNAGEQPKRLHTTHIQISNLEQCNREYNLNLKITVLWDFMLYRLANRCQHFWEACTLRIQNSYRKVQFSWTTLKIEAARTTVTMPPLLFGLPWRNKRIAGISSPKYTASLSTRRHFHRRCEKLTSPKMYCNEKKQPKTRWYCFSRMIVPFKWILGLREVSV